MKYLQKSFSVPMSGSKEHDRIFGIRFTKKHGRIKIIRQLSNGLYLVMKVFFNNHPIKDDRGFTPAIVVEEKELKLTR